MIPCKREARHGIGHTCMRCTDELLNPFSIALLLLVHPMSLLFLLLLHLLLLHEVRLVGYHRK
jgi:hypothetical protein